MIQAVIFDRDGVLTYFDTEAAKRYFAPLLPISIYELAERWELWGARRGSPRSFAEEQAFFRSYWDTIADEFGLAARERRALHVLDYARFVSPYPEVKDVLACLHAAGIRIGVLSNFGLASLSESLRTAGLAPWIDAACAAPVIGHAKPAAAAYQIALDVLGANADACLFFDDEPACVAGGQQVGMRSFLVDRQRSSTADPARVVTDLTGVPALVKRYSST